MIRNFALMFLVLLFPVSAFAGSTTILGFNPGIVLAQASRHDAPEWTIDPAHSSVTFSVRHIFTPLVGSFSQVSGSLRFDPRNLKGSRIAVRIPVSTINTRIDARDSHLRSSDFFNVSEFPDMTFVSDTFLKQGRDRYLMKGLLTIHGITRKVNLPFQLIGIRKHPMKPNALVAGASSEFRIKRSDFGVGSGNFAATAIIGDDITITLGIEATRPE